MAEKLVSNQGLKRMVRRCRTIFQQPENTNHYDTADYQAAERKFVKFCMLTATGHAS